MILIGVCILALQLSSVFAQDFSIPSQWVVSQSIASYDSYYIALTLPWLLEHVLFFESRRKGAVGAESVRGHRSSESVPRW